MKNDLPPVFVPSDAVLEKMIPAADKPRWDSSQLGKKNALVLLREAFPGVLFSVRLANSRRYGKGANIKWPLLPGAPSVEEVKRVVACFESQVGFGPYHKVLPNDEGLCKIAFQNKFGGLVSASLVPWEPTPQERQAMLEESLPSAPAPKAPRPRF